MECLNCKGRLVKGTAPFSVDRGGYHIYWNAVPAFHPNAAAALGTPAWICTVWRAVVRGYEVDVIQEAIKALDQDYAEHGKSGGPAEPFWRCAM